MDTIDMEEDVEEPTLEENEEKFRKMLFGIAGILLLFVVATIAFQYINFEEPHPPQVSIERSGDNVSVVYLGGIDNGFVGDFKITTEFGTIDYPKPKYERDLVGTVYAPRYTCVNVAAINKATQSYRAIGYKCL